MRARLGGPSRLSRSAWSVGLFCACALAACSGPGTADVSGATTEPRRTATEASQTAEPPQTPESAEKVEPRAQCRGRQATLVGTGGADRLRLTDRRDVVAARAGDDVLVGLDEDDIVCAGPGDDKVTSTSTRFAWVVEAGPGDDVVRLVETTDVYAGSGDDRVVVERGVGGLHGGPGDDFLRTLSSRMPSGYPENTPCLSYSQAPRPVRVDLGAGFSRGEGLDTVEGFHCVRASRYNDVVVGTDSRDGLEGGAGADLVRGGGGNDMVRGGPGADRLYLGGGFDYADGSPGRDRLYGEEGPDVLEGWTQSDYLDGGPGNDQVYGAIFCAVGGNSYDTGGKLDGAADELFGGDGDDYLVGDRGNDRVDGGAGHDWAQPGHRDGRIDWVEAVEEMVDGCLENVRSDRPFDPAEAKDVHPW